MKNYLIKFWKKILVIRFRLNCSRSRLSLMSMLIRQTTYEEGSQYLDELSGQIASSIEKQSRDHWNMLDMFYRYFIDYPGDRLDGLGQLYSGKESGFWI